MNVGIDNGTIMGVSITFLIANLSLLLIGFVIMKYQLSDIIAGFNPEKDDKTKVSKLVGENFMFAGLVSLIGEAIYFVCRDKLSPVFYVVYVLLVLCAMFINLSIRWRALRKLSDNSKR